MYKMVCVGTGWKRSFEGSWTFRCPELRKKARISCKVEMWFLNMRPIIIITLKLYVKHLFSFYTIEQAILTEC